jgi:hypothetical protein
MVDHKALKELLMVYFFESQGRCGGSCSPL